MKIQILAPLAERRGGAELALWRLMESGQNQGTEWLVVFLEDGPMVQELRTLGIDTRVVPSGRVRHLHRYPGSVWKIASIARRERVDAILGWMTKAHLYGGPAAVLARIPSLWYQHGFPARDSLLDRAAALLPASGVLTCSYAVAAEQARLGPARATRVVYPGISLTTFEVEALPVPGEIRLSLGLPVGGPLIGFFGRLQRWKGAHALIAAMPRVLQRFPDAHCAIVGGQHELEPEYPAYLRERIAALGLKERATLFGFKSDVARWMHAMDVIALPSDREPFGMAILEAMALGKPVIAASSGGPREIVTDGVDGVLVADSDPDALADAIVAYLERPDLARSVSRAARKRAAEFSTERYAQSVVATVTELVSPG